MLSLVVLVLGALLTELGVLVRDGKVFAGGALVLTTDEVADLFVLGLKVISNSTHREEGLQRTCSIADSSSCLP